MIEDAGGHLVPVYGNKLHDNGERYICSVICVHCRKTWFYRDMKRVSAHMLEKHSIEL